MDLAADAVDLSGVWGDRGATRLRPECGFHAISDRLQQQSNERFERLLKGRGAAERADIYAVVGVPGVVDILVAAIDAEPDKLAEDLAHHPPFVVVAARRLRKPPHDFCATWRA